MPETEVSPEVDRVARAIYEDWRDKRGGPLSDRFENLPPFCKALAVSHAKAAIAAMEPR